MLNSLKTALLAAGAALALAGSAQAQAPTDLSAFDIRSAGGWAERLVLCDYTAFLSNAPDLNANRMWVRRDDGHSELMLPPDFVGGGQWYKEGYQRLYFKLQRHGQISSRQVSAAQNGIGRDFVETYRRQHVWRQADLRFLRQQDSACRAMARQEGEIIS